MLDSINLSTARWVKSTYSQQGGDCVEAAPNIPGLLPVRDSKDPSGPALIFPTAAWQSFITAIRTGEFDTQ
ncbi:DUF397 domain-containing protein [Kitasatospora sp. NPDC057936]|uniref:DUF397 domain-containing protein n=1 Tax=Kitasatospora sp. NPDC057936 TaxID=3346283 RepID=UPI0036DCF582